MTNALQTPPAPKAKAAREALKTGTVARTPGGPRWTKGDRVQPLHVLDSDHALLTTATVAALTGDSVATINRKVAAGTFPPPITHGVRDKRWPAWVVRSHLRHQAEAQGVVMPSPGTAPRPRKAAVAAG